MALSSASTDLAATSPASPPEYGACGKAARAFAATLARDARFAILVNPKNPQAQSVIADVQSPASAMGRQLEIF